VVNCILCYIHGTSHSDLSFTISHDVLLYGFRNSNWAGNVHDHEFINAYYNTLKLVFIIINDALQ